MGIMIVPLFKLSNKALMFFMILGMDCINSGLKADPVLFGLVKRPLPKKEIGDRNGE